jgi:quercetin dioxygenase-like cupin family protein
MERFTFAEGYEPEDARLDGVTIAPLTSSMREGAPFQAAIFRLAPGGRMARHPAAVPQLLAVLEGSGVVSGADGVEEPIHAGEAVVWAAGEQHETRSDGGLVALVLEGVGLR